MLNLTVVTITKSLNSPVQTIKLAGDSTELYYGLEISAFRSEAILNITKYMNKTCPDAIVSNILIRDNDDIRIEVIGSLTFDECHVMEISSLEAVSICASGNTASSSLEKEMQAFLNN